MHDLPSVDDIVGLIRDCAREDADHITTLGQLAAAGITPAAKEWHEAIEIAREADDLADPYTDVTDMVDGPVWDADTLRADLVDVKYRDIAYAVRQWILHAQMETRTSTEYAVRWPDGGVAHRWANQDKAAQLQYRTAEQGTELVSREVVRIYRPWRVVRDVARDRGAA